MSKIRVFAFLALPLLLSGCSLLPLLLKPYRQETAIASDIPTSPLACATVQRSNEPELSERKNISSQIETAFASNDFKALENYYTLYRQGSNRTAGGRWKLQFFYAGLQPPEYNKQDWLVFEAKLLDWIEAYPQSPAAHIAYSSFLRHRAWHFRGGEYANKVSQKAWKLFHEDIELTRLSLLGSKDFASTDPQWYVEMLTVARAQNWQKSKIKALFREAISKEPYYLDTYQEAFEYLLPKWHGSYAEAEEFASDAVNITSKCEGSSMYARIYWRALNWHSEFKENPFGSSKIDWEKMKMGFEDIITLYPDPWNINNYAKFACLAQDKETAKRLFSQIQSSPILEAWESPEAFLTCQQWALE